MSRIDAAFEACPRKFFLPADQVPYAHIDAPLPIGHGQTNSQPSTVRQMLEWLQPTGGDKVLDVGSGSGWTTALLAYLVVETGEVYAVEKLPAVKEFGEQNCKKLAIKNAYFFLAGDELGLPEYAPYDRILVSAGAASYPGKLLEQLRPGGKAVIPIKSSIHAFTKQHDGSIADEEHPGYAFVPLV